MQWTKLGNKREEIKNLTVENGARQGERDLKKRRENAEIKGRVVDG